MVVGLEGKYSSYKNSTKNESLQESAFVENIQEFKKR